MEEQVTNGSASIVIVCELGALILGTVIAVARLGSKWGSMSKDLEYIRRDIKEMRDLFKLSPITPASKRRN